VHNLHAETFVDGQKLCLGAIDLFLFGCGLDRPVKSALVMKSGRRMTEIQQKVDLSL
jgi:hypothetical protein